VPRSQQQLKPQNISRGRSAPSPRPPIKPDGPSALKQPPGTMSLNIHTLPPGDFSSSVWSDALAGLLFCTVVFGVLAYFLGWLPAIAAVATIIVALAWCLNRSVADTIEF